LIENFVEFTKEDASRVSIEVSSIHIIEEKADRTVIKCYEGAEFLVVDLYTQCLERIKEAYGYDEQD
jgi:hypothetical protein